MVAPSTVAALLEGGEPDHPAVVVPNRTTLSYARLRELTDEAAQTLATHGIATGERVAMVFPNGPEAILFFLAASMVATACPLNPAYKEEEFRFYLEDVGARFLLVPPGEGEAARRAMPAGGTVIEANLDRDGRLVTNGAGHRKQVDSLDLSAAGDIGLVSRSASWTAARASAALGFSQVLVSAGLKAPVQAKRLKTAFPSSLSHSSERTLTGSVVELGDRLGIPVPHLRTLYASVKLLQATSTG